VSKTQKSEQPNSKSSSLANDKIVVLAAFLAGAANGYADTEDIAVQAAKMAPGRFSWRKYPDQINIDTVRKRLWDAASEKKGGLLTGSEKDGWLLTESGLQFCSEHDERLKTVDATVMRRSKKEQPWATRERARMCAEAAYTKWADGQVKEVTSVEAERFFRIDDYIVGDLRQSRISRAKDTFATDPTMSEAIEEIAKKVRARE